MCIRDRFNPSLVEHASAVADKANIKNFEQIGTAIVEPMQLASAFISKGGGSFFGLVADIITTAVGRVLGSDLLSSAGGVLGGFTNAVNSTLLSEITSAKPKIADYEFTTLTLLLDIDFLTIPAVTFPGPI